MNAADTVYPVVIDPSVVIVSGTVSAEDTYVDQQYPNSNYGQSETLWTGGSYGPYAKRTYLNFYYPLNILPFQITSVYVYMPKSGYQTPNIRAYAITDSWYYESLTWNNQPNHSETIYSSLSQNTTRYENPNWYKMEITDILKGWLDLSIGEYGLVLMEAYEDESGTTTSYYSSEAEYPNNPELEINYNPYYGSRLYQNISGAYANCMGYALEYDENVTEDKLNIDETEIYGGDIWTVGRYYREMFDEWMQDHLGADNWAYLATYNSGIEENWFRVCYFVNFPDKNNNGICDGEDESPGYHWFYQTKTGHWAEKYGSYLSTFCHTNKSAGIDPLTIWEARTNNNTDSSERQVYTYGFYQVRDIRNVSWRY